MISGTIALASAHMKTLNIHNLCERGLGSITIVADAFYGRNGQEEITMQR